MYTWHQQRQCWQALLTQNALNPACSQHYAVAAAAALVLYASSQLVISAAGKNFCAGLDLSYLTDTFGSKMQPSSSSSSSSCPARMRYAFRQDILQMQVSQPSPGIISLLPYHAHHSEV
jgi:enoyl-CoA hydratase/carnithine racemase